MHIFLSWSGELSRRYATAFKKLLESVIQGVDVYVSTENKKGKAWYVQITENLQKTDYMVTFLTRENQYKPWINFEAGAVAARSENSFCSALLIDLKPDQIAGPLVNLHHTKNNRKDIKNLVQQINTSKGIKPIVKEDILVSTLDKFWGDYESEIKEIPPNISTSEIRTTEEKVDDLKIQTENHFHFLREEVQAATRMLFVNKNLPLIEESFKNNNVEKIGKRPTEVIRLYFGIERKHSLSIEEIGERFGLEDLQVINDLVEGVRTLQKLK